MWTSLLVLPAGWSYVKLDLIQFLPILRGGAPRDEQNKIHTPIHIGTLIDATLASLMQACVRLHVPSFVLFWRTYRHLHYYISILSLCVFSIGS